MGEVAIVIILGNLFEDDDDIIEDSLNIENFRM